MKRIIVLLALLSKLGFAGAQNLGVSSAQWIGGSGAPSLSCSATAYNGVFYTDKAASVLYQCFPVSGTWTWHAVGASGGGSGTVSTATANAMAYYSGTGTTVGGAAGLSTPGTGMLSSAATDPLIAGASIPYIYGSINGGNAQTEFRSVQGGLDFSSPIVGVIKMNNAGNIGGGFGVMGLCNISSDGGSPAPSACVGVYGQARVTGNSMNAWGGNFLASTNPGNPGTIRAAEFDINALNAGDQAYGITVQGSWGAQPSAPSTAVLVETLGGISGVHWTTDFQCEGSSATTCLDAEPTVIGNSEPSMPIALDNYDSGGTLRKSTLSADANGNVVITPYSGATTVKGTLNATTALTVGGVPTATLGSNNFGGLQSLIPGTPSTAALNVKGAVSTSSIEVQNCPASGNVTSCTLGSSVSVGNTLVVAVWDAGGSSDSLTDSLGNTIANGNAAWYMESSAPSHHLQVFTIPITIGGTDTVSSVGGNYVQVMEFTNIALTSPFDGGTGAYTGSSGSTLSTSTFTPSVGDMVFSWLTADDAGPGAAPAGFSFVSALASGCCELDSAYVQSAVPLSAVWNTTANAGHWAFASIVGFKLGGGTPQSAQLATFTDVQTNDVVSGVDAQGGPYIVPVLYSALPTCTASTWDASHVGAGDMRSINDDTASTYNATAGGSGTPGTSTTFAVFCNGATWVNH